MRSCFPTIFFAGKASISRNLHHNKEKHTLLDLAKLKYAFIPQESASSIPNIDPVSRRGSNVASPFDEGWAWRGAKKPHKFNEKQRKYLEAKFDIRQGTGKKVST